MNKGQITVKAGFAWWVKPCLVAMKKSTRWIVPIIGADRTIKLALWLTSKGVRVETP